MKKALFVGVDQYDDPVIHDLQCAANDAALILAQFRAVGFDPVMLPNPTKQTVLNAFDKMKEGLGAGDEFLFYFAGHGFAAPGGNDHLLFCRDDKYANIQFNAAGISFAMLQAGTDRPGLSRMFIIDACRSNPFTARGAGQPRDFLPEAESYVRNVRAGGLAVIRSCGQGQCALELPDRCRGLFSLAMDEVIENSRKSGRELVFGQPFLTGVYDRMEQIARKEGLPFAQTPEIKMSANWGRVVLVPGRAPEKPQSSPLVTCPSCGFKNHEGETFRCRVCGRAGLCKSHYDEQANCCADCAAKTRGAKPGGEASPPGGSAPGDALVKTIELPGGAKMEMVFCRPGTFWMGSENGEYGRKNDETYHRVTLTKGFWMGKYPVTQGQWKSVMGNNPSSFTGNDARPVEQVSWNDCVKFIERASAGLSDVQLRLPTEAEWEYACRAGTTGPYGGTGKLWKMGHCGGPLGSLFSKTHPVGKKTPNAWGLYDMHGNVWEWCADWYGAYPSGDVTDPPGLASGSCRVQRGGSWRSHPLNCRSACRSSDLPTYKSAGIGFRLCSSAGLSWLCC